MLKTKIIFVGTLLFLLPFSTLPNSLRAQNNQIETFSAVSLYKLASDFEQPVGIVSTGLEGDERLFILEKRGRIYIYLDGEVSDRPFLDISDQVSTEQERGLMSLVFDPDYDLNGLFYVHYSEGGDPDSATYGDTVISRFNTSVDDNLADVTTEEILLEVSQEFDNHNGGEIFFDLTDNLIIGLGDGGGPGDPLDRAMNRSYLLGKMLRINVHGDGIDPVRNCGRVQKYKIPLDNPRPNGENGWCPEILSTGLRNPWRASLDRDTGKIFVADVGENRFEEINIIPADTTTLHNYGWPCFEAWDIFKYPCELDDDSVFRVPFEGYARLDEDKNFIGASITGGYIYTGSTFPEWKDSYFYGDYISGRIWALDKNSTDSDVISTELIQTDMRIPAFGKGSDGELYVLDFVNGELYQMLGNQAVEINVVPPIVGEPGKEAVWRYEVKNIGAEPIDLVTITQSIPAGITWKFGGDYTDQTVQLAAENIPSGETQTVLWTGQLPDAPQTITTDQPQVDTGAIAYVVDHSRASSFTVANLDLTFSLPVVLR